MDGNYSNHPGHRVMAQFVNLHPVLSRGLNRFSDDFREEPRGPSHAMTRDERPGINFMLLGPLALISATTNRSGVLILVCKAIEIMLIVTIMMQIRDVKFCARRQMWTFKTQQLD